MAFLTHYQLPIRYETGTEILSSFKQSSSTHISDDIHERRRRRWLIKVPLLDQLLADWFTKSLIGPISHDVSMSGIFTKEKAISRSQYLDLIYSQMGTLYDFIPDSPRPSTNPTPTPSTSSHDVDGMIGTFHAETRSAHASHTNPESTASNAKNTPTPTPFTDKTYEVNSVQSTPTGKNQIKIKGRVRIRKTKIIINNLKKPKQKLLMRKINVNLITLALFVVMIITKNIVQDALRLLSSSKGLRSLLHLSFCHNLSILSNMLNWSFMTKLLPITHLMSLRLLVTLKRTKLQSQLEPKIILCQKRKLMMYHLRWCNLFPQLHLQMVRNKRFWVRSPVKSPILLWD
jgi:hypothetical protein